MSDEDALPDEQLVAYLDGELDAENARRIEALLASNPMLRRRLQSLERTWELLDELDSAAVGEPFTRTTLEMVAVAVSREIDGDLAPRQRRRRWLVVTALLLAAATVGFLMAAVLMPDPNASLLRDLPVLENFDEYRVVENIDFLRLLRDKRLFCESSAESRSAPAALPRESSQAQRRQWIEAMPSADKEQLRRASERFARLEPARQQALRQLHASLQDDPDAPTLRLIMRNYYEWLNALSAYSRAELNDLSPENRLATIEKRLQDQHRREGGRRLGEKDMESLLAWLHDYAARHDDEFVRSRPDPKQRERISKLGPEMRHLAFLREVWQPWMSAGSGTPPPMMTDDDWNRLLATLSPAARARLEKKPRSQQSQMLALWSRHALQHRISSRGLRVLPRGDDERLADFFETGLSDEERDRLLSLPAEEMQRRLQQYYLMRHRPPESTPKTPPLKGSPPAP